ncbi:hypothetical protein [Legionella sp. WA2024007413]
MKVISVTGINLTLTKWIVSESKSPLDEEDNLCLFECSSSEEAQKMMENIKLAFTTDYSMDVDLGEHPPAFLDYYLETHRNYVIASTNFLERYFDGKVEEVPKENQSENKSFFIYASNMGDGDNSHIRMIIVNNNQNSLTIKPILAEPMTEDLIDFSEEYLGATSYTKRNKTSAQVKEAYNFNGLFSPSDNFSVLWLPAKSHHGRPMFTAYGCSSHKIAKMLETKIKEDEKKKQKATPLVTNSEHITLVCEGPILIASRDYLEQIYGTPIQVSLVNDLTKQGLADKQSKQRTLVVDKMYLAWDEKVKLRNQPNLLKLQGRTTQRFFPPQFAPTGTHLKPIYVSPFNSKNTVVPMPDPLIYPNICIEGKTIVPKPDALPLPFMSTQQKSGTNQEATKLTAPRAQSMFHDSNSNEPIKTFTEEEYLSFFN